MREQVDRLTKLATDLLDLSRLDAGRLTVVSEPIDLAELADELAARVPRRAPRPSRHRARAGRARSGVGALGDAERALQIGRILVENALVHTPPGTTVRVSSAARRRPRDPDRRQRRARASRARPSSRSSSASTGSRAARASGSGLGLAIARELAEVMGGRIELDSQNGWTLFTLVLSAAPTSRERPG